MAQLEKFVFIGHRPMMFKFLNTEYEFVPTVQAPVRRTSRQTNGIPEITYSYSKGLKLEIHQTSR
jgi:hypothetical protein